MITIISGTNRPNSNTLKIANIYKQVFASKGFEASVLNLEWLEQTTRNEVFTQVETDVLIPTQKFVIISPEYNGTFTGILKLLIDISDVKKVWASKSVILVGVASGRAGNLRGLDNLTNAFNYLKAHVLPNKLPISSINNELNEAGELVNQSTIDAINQQVYEFISL